MQRRPSHRRMQNQTKSQQNVNCGGPHPANFSGCPSNPVNRKQTKTNSTTTSGRRSQGARPESHTTHNKTKPMLRQWLKTRKKQTHLMPI
ncbi:hypothetical protein TNCV_277701 [Trichonephila clavipes]|nr:hypothetical protein TNCV_277701 [Trichonephila clavipes]